MDIADGVEDAVKHPGIIVSVYSRAGDGVLINLLKGSYCPMDT